MAEVCSGSTLEGTHNPDFHVKGVGVVKDNIKKTNSGRVDGIYNK